MKAIKKQDAAVAASGAWKRVYEVQTLHGIAQCLQAHHVEGCSDGTHQVTVLSSIAEEKLEEALLAIGFAHVYFKQESKQRKQTSTSNGKVNIRHKDANLVALPQNTLVRRKRK